MACGQADGRLDVMAGHRPPRRRYRRLSQAQVGLDPGFPGRRVIAQPPDEPGAGGGCFVDPAGQGQRLDEHELGPGPLRTTLEQVSGPAQGAGGGRQRPDLQRVAAGVPQEPPGPGPVSRPGRQVGGHVPPPASQVWVGGVDGRERVRRRLAQPGRERGHQHRFTGECVAELESRPVGGDENAVDRPGQGPGHHLRGPSAGRLQDLPVEVMPQHRGCLENGALAVGELREPFSDRLADGVRDAGRGQEFLDEEGYALRRPPNPGVLFGVGIGRASGDHLSHLALSEAAEREVHDARPSPLPPGQVRCRGRQLGAERDGEQDRLADGVVGQVLHQGHRVGVCPVQVLQGDHQPIRPQAAQQPQHRLPPDGLRVQPPARVSRPVVSHCFRQQDGQVRQPWRQRQVIGQRTSAQQLQQRLSHRPVRGAGRGRDGPAHHDRNLPAGRHPRQLPDQAGLADAGLTGDDGTATPAGEHSGQGRLQRLDLGPPPHQDWAQHFPHHPSVPHRRQGRSVITRPTPARASGCRTYRLRPSTATAQNTRI